MELFIRIFKLNVWWWLVSAALAAAFMCVFKVLDIYEGRAKKRALKNRMENIKKGDRENEKK